MTKRVGFLSTFGALIILLSIVGCLVGLYEASVLGSLVVAVLSVFGLIGGLYVGGLGVEIDRLGEQIESLSKSVRSVEPSGAGPDLITEGLSSRRESRRGFLINLGYSEEEVAKLGDLAMLTNEQFAVLVRKKAEEKRNQPSS